MIIPDYHFLKTNTEIPAYIKVLIGELQSKGYLSIGKWLSKIATGDLLSVMLSADELKFRNVPSKRPLIVIPHIVGDSFLLIMDLMSIGEGLEITRNKIEMPKRLNLLDSYVKAELFKRRGIPMPLVYKKMSLDLDPNDDSIIKPGGKEELLKALEELIGKKLIPKKEGERNLEEEEKDLSKILNFKMAKKLPPEDAPSQIGEGLPHEIDFFEITMNGKLPSYKSEELDLDKHFKLKKKKTKKKKKD